MHRALLLVGLLTAWGCGGSTGETTDAIPADRAAEETTQLQDTREVRLDLPPVPAETVDTRLPDSAPAPWTWRDPWPAPQGPWGTCPDVQGTEESLAQKAAYFDWYTPRLLIATGTTDDGRVIDYGHVHDANVDGDMPTEIGPDDSLPVVLEYTGFGNSGLYTSLYTASQAFRYGTTGEAEALENVRKTLKALHVNLLITGTPGYFARGFKPPLPGFDIPENPTPADRCITEGEFQGFCWVGDTSRDEYIGIMFAVAAAAKLVDDQEIQELSADMAAQVGHHLIDNNYVIHDENGQPTEHGACHPFAFNHFPGFHAAMALAWTSVAARVSGDPEIQEAYHKCLLQEDVEEVHVCIDDIPMGSFLDYLEGVGSLLGCGTSYDNVSMSTLALLLTVWMEEDPDLRAFYQDKLVEDTKGPDPDGYDIWAQGSPHFGFIFAAFQPLDPARQGRPNGELIDEAICTLKRFPADKILVGQTTTYLPEHCTNVKGHSWTDQVTPIEDRPPRQFLWWSSPYERYTAMNNPQHVVGAQDYLLSYWMGRYFGFISEDL